MCQIEGCQSTTPTVEFNGQSVCLDCLAKLLKVKPKQEAESAALEAVQAGIFRNQEGAQRFLDGNCSSESGCIACSA